MQNQPEQMRRHGEEEDILVIDSINRGDQSIDEICDAKAVLNDCNKTKIFTDTAQSGREHRVRTEKSKFDQSSH
jgi:hypothetical protein